MSDIIFQKTLSDLIKGIRGNKLATSEFISTEVTCIKAEIRSSDPFIKAEGIRKLTYLQMLGYDISWAAFTIIEVMSFPRFAHKQMGYLAANQSFNESTDLILLATNLFKKELAISDNSNQYEVGLALNSISNVVTAELGRDCLSDVANLINNSRPYLRKRAVLALYKLYIKYPAGLRLTFNLIKDRLDDEDSSVVSTAVSVVCELANRNPQNYLALAPKFFKLLTTSSNNWLLIKLVKLFGLLVSEEPRLARKLVDPLVTLILNNTAKSLQFECIHTLTTAFLHTKKEDGADAKNVPNAVQVCSDYLKGFIADSDQNLKYLGLVGLINLMRSHPRVVVEHRDSILLCLHDDDFTIRTKALELLAGIVSKKSLMDIVKHLLQHVADSEGSYRDQIVATVLQMCSKEKYSLVTDFAWYVSVLVELCTLHGCSQGKLLAAQLIDVTLRVRDVRAYTAHSLLPFLLSEDLVLSKGSATSEHILQACSWIVGEYSSALALLTGEKASEEGDDDGLFWMDGPEGEDVSSAYHGQSLHVQLMQNFLNPQMFLLSSEAQALVVHASFKVFIRACQDCSEATVAQLLAIVRANIDYFLQSPVLEVAERAAVFRHLLSSLLILPTNLGDENRHESSSSDLIEVGESAHERILPSDWVGAKRAVVVKHLLSALVTEPFYIVSSKAQRRVPVPLGLDLLEAVNPAALESFMTTAEADAENGAACNPQNLTLFLKRAPVSTQARSYYGEGSYSNDYQEPHREYSSYEKPAPLATGYSSSAAAASSNNNNEKNDSLFYLRPNASAVDVQPLSKVLLETFEESGLGKSKKTKKSKKNKVDMVEMQPAGALSSDEEESGKRRSGKSKKRDSSGVQTLDNIDITTPLAPDEVFPVHRHRDAPVPRPDATSSESKAQQDPSIAKKKRSKKKDKEAPVASLSNAVDDLLGMDWPAAVASAQYESLPNESSKSSSKSHKLWMPLVANPFFEVFYALRAVSDRELTIYFRTVNVSKTLPALSCTATLSNAGQMKQLSLATSLAPSTEGKTSIAWTGAFGDDSGRRVDCAIKVTSLPAVPVEFQSINCRLVVYSCLFFSPHVLTLPGYQEELSKASKRWVSSQLSRDYSGKLKSAVKSLAALLNASVLESDDGSTYLSSKSSPKAYVYLTVSPSGRSVAMNLKVLGSSKSHSQMLHEELTVALSTFLL